MKNFRRVIFCFSLCFGQAFSWAIQCNRPQVSELMARLNQTLSQTTRDVQASPLGIPRRVTNIVSPQNDKMMRFVDHFDGALTATFADAVSQQEFAQSPILTVARAFKMNRNHILKSWADEYQRSIQNRLAAYELKISPLLEKLKVIIGDNPLPSGGGDLSKHINKVIEEYFKDPLLASLKEQGRVPYRAVSDLAFADALASLGFIGKNGVFEFDGQGRKRLEKFLTAWSYAFLEKSDFTPSDFVFRFLIFKSHGFDSYYDLLRATIQYLGFVEMHKGNFANADSFFSLMLDEVQIDLSVRNTFEVGKYSKPKQYFPFLIFPENLAHNLRGDYIPDETSEVFESSSLYQMYNWMHIGDREFRFVDPHRLERQLEALKVRVDLARTQLTDHVSQFARFLSVHYPGELGSPDSRGFLSWIIFQLYHIERVPFVDDMISKGSSGDEGHRMAATYILDLMEQRLPFEYQYFFGDNYSRNQVMEYTQGALNRIVSLYRFYRAQ